MLRGVGCDGVSSLLRLRYTIKRDDSSHKKDVARTVGLTTWSSSNAVA